MEVLIEELTEKQKRVLKNPEAYEAAHDSLAADNLICVCDNCRRLITARSSEDKSKILPAGVFHSKYFFGNKDYDSFEMCLDCHNAMEEEIAMVFEKYRRKRRE